MAPLNFDSEFDRNISKNLNEIKQAEIELEQEVDNLKSHQSKYKSNLFTSKEEFEEYTVKNFDELKSYESDLKWKLTKALKVAPILINANEEKDEKIAELKSLLLNKLEPRLVLHDKTSRLNTESQLTVKKQIELLRKDCDLLENIYQNEEEKAKNICETIGEKLKDCHIVYSNKKL